MAKESQLLKRRTRYERLENIRAEPRIGRDGDEYENEAECPVCEREFKLMCSMSIDYEAKTMESEDDGVLLG